MLVVKNPPANTGDLKERDLGLIPGSERSPGEGNGNPLQYSCLENSMGRGPWWATVHMVAKSWTWLKRLCKLQKRERGGQKSHFHACKRILFSNDTKGHYEQQGDRFWFNIWTNTHSTPQENSTPSEYLQPEAGWYFWRCHGRNFIETLEHRP